MHEEWTDKLFRGQIQALFGFHTGILNVLLHWKPTSICLVRLKLVPDLGHHKGGHHGKDGHNTVRLEEAPSYG